MERNCLSIILAAGEGTRMKSSMSKVLHPIANLSLIGHICRTLKNIHIDSCACIVGKSATQVESEVKKFLPKANFFFQNERLGTAHAVLCAKDIIQSGFDDILILFGDTPLIEEHNLQKARESLAQGIDVVVMGFRTETPTGYGRLIEESGYLKAIVEEKDATDVQKAIKFCNGGLMAVSGVHLLKLLEKVENNNANKEFYLTDIVALAHKENLKVQALEIPLDNILGVNTRAELAKLEEIWQERKRNYLMREGVTLLDPKTNYFSYDSIIEQDVIIEPYVYFGKNVHIKTGAKIAGFSYIEGATIEEDSTIGPYARIRAQSVVKKNAKVGNFCEVKNTIIEEEAKINHLSYIGDANIGKRVNRGAGVITCNYDGISKHKTIIEADSFVGSNSALVAPLKIEKNAYIASGSIITRDIPEKALAVARAKQVNKEGYAEKLQDKFMRNASKK